MGRNKINRECSFMPAFKKFIPSPNEQNGMMELNHDEIEALFLMDYQNMYQEDAAKKMNVSRPTLSRIIKSARNKIATAIILGYEISINDLQDQFIIAICLEKENYFATISNKNPLIALITLKNGNIQEIIYVANPLMTVVGRPSKVLPEFFKDKKVNYLVSSQIGEGLKNSLHAQGIFTKEIEKINSFEDVKKSFCK